MGITLAQQLRSEAGKVLSDDTQKNYMLAIGICRTAAANGKFVASINTSQMRNPAALVDKLKQDGLIVETKENKDQRGEIESYSLVISW